MKITCYIQVKRQRASDSVTFIAATSSSRSKRPPVEGRLPAIRSAARPVLFCDVAAERRVGKGARRRNCGLSVGGESASAVLRAAAARQAAVGVGDGEGGRKGNEKIGRAHV